jgi:hypothetical protein
MMSTPSFPSKNVIICDLVVWNMTKPKVEVKLVEEFRQWPRSDSFPANVKNFPNRCVFMQIKQMSLVSCCADGDTNISWLNI